MAKAAHRAVRWPFGPTCRAGRTQTIMDQFAGGRRGATAFASYAADTAPHSKMVPLVPSKMVYERANGRASRATVVIPQYNYDTYILETLESVRSQTMPDLDLIVVDYKSTDNSQALVLKWMEQHYSRFNRCALLQHINNSGLGNSRNTGFDDADTLYIMALDADNLLKPLCCETLYAACVSERAGFAYSTLQQFGTGRCSWAISPSPP